DMTMDEIDDAANYIKGEVDEDAEIFWGVVFDESMEDEVQITVIATGIDKDSYSKVVNLRDVSPDEADGGWTVKVNGESLDGLDVPAFQRRKVKEPEAPAPVRHEHMEEDKKNFFKKAFFKDNLDYPTFLRAKAD
ncbi:cell division protein FtsZ, partial [Thermodesulfobacteriota bacterium]